jgi:periplasmic copper chaperone A
MRFILGMALLLALAGCGGARPEPRVIVDEAWVQLPAVPGRPGAAYFTLQSNHDQTRLVSISSPRVQRIELHDSRMEGDVMRMGPLEDRNFPPSGTLEFAPGGKHAMLFGLDPTVRAGERIPLTFTFEPLPPVTVEAEVRAFGASHGGH